MNIIKRNCMILILILAIIFSVTTSSFAEQTETENKVKEYINYVIPFNYQEIPVETDSAAETDLLCGDFRIDITVYEATGENTEKIFTELNGRSGNDILIQNRPARVGKTDIDRIVVVKNGKYLVEFFAVRERGLFTGKTFTKDDEKIFHDFLKTVEFVNGEK